MKKLLLLLLIPLLSASANEIKLTGYTFDFGFKKITMNSSGLPANISVGDEAVFSHPAKLVIRSSGKKINPVSVFEINQKDKNCFSGKSIGNCKDFSLQTSFNLAGDGVFEYSVTLTPKKSFTIEEFALILPLNLPDDRLFSCEKMAPKAPGSGLDAERRRIRKVLKNAESYSGEFAPDFWVGNTRYGIAVNFENCRNWEVKPDSAVEFDGKNQLRFNFINLPFEVNKTMTWKFYFSVTPLRKFSDTWRQGKFRTRYGNMTPSDGNQMIYWGGNFYSFSGIYNNMWIREKLFRDVAEYDKKRLPDVGIMHYTIHWLITPRAVFECGGKYYLMENPVLMEICRKYGTISAGYSKGWKNVPGNCQKFTDWQELSKLIGGADQLFNGVKTVATDVYSVHLSPDYIDYLIKQAELPLSLGSRGIYADGLRPVKDYRNAFTDRYGKEWGDHDIPGVRKLYREIRKKIQSLKPAGQMIAHNSELPYTPALAYFDMILIGETDFYWYQEPSVRDLSKNGDFYYAHIWGSPDRLKFLYPRTWGIPVVLLPELRGKNGKVFSSSTRGTRTMLCYTIQFDFLYWPLWCDAAEIRKFDAIRHKFGMNSGEEETLEFIPYWENTSFKAADQAVKIGYYQRIPQFDPNFPTPLTRKHLLLISNFQFAPADTLITLPKLKELKVKNSITDQTIPLKDGKLPVKLDQYDFTVIEVSGEEE